MPLSLLAVVPLSAGGDWLARVAQVFDVLSSIAGLAVAVGLAVAAVRISRSVPKLAARFARASADAAPAARHAARIAQNVDEVTTSLRADVARVSDLVARAEARIEDTLVRAEARARDLEALLDVAQGQAERSLVEAASTVAGVREGFAALRDELAGASRGDDAAEGGGTRGTGATIRDVDPAVRPRIRTRDV